MAALNEDGIEQTYLDALLDALESVPRRLGRECQELTHNLLRDLFADNLPSDDLTYLDGDASRRADLQNG
jgi:hypothetical protein